jgi:hypothetical protein
MTRLTGWRQRMKVSDAVSGAIGVFSRRKVPERIGDAWKDGECYPDALHSVASLDHRATMETAVTHQNSDDQWLATRPSSVDLSGAIRDGRFTSRRGQRCLAGLIRFLSDESGGLTWKVCHSPAIDQPKTASGSTTGGWRTGPSSRATAPNSLRVAITSIAQALVPRRARAVPPAHRSEGTGNLGPRAKARAAMSAHLFLNAEAQKAQRLAEISFPGNSLCDPLRPLRLCVKSYAPPSPTRTTPPPNSPPSNSRPAFKRTSSLPKKTASSNRSRSAGTRAAGSGSSARRPTRSSFPAKSRTTKCSSSKTQTAMAFATRRRCSRMG